MSYSLRKPALSLLAAALTCLGTAVYAQGVTDAMLAAEAGDNWLHVNGNYAGYRYSTLGQISDSNAKNLKVAWTSPLGATTDTQATPLYYDGLLYIPQDNKVYAISADDGSVVWKYEHKVPDDIGGVTTALILNRHRGVALYGDSVYFLSSDSKLHRLDMKTGKAKWAKAFEGFTYPKDFAKAKDASGYLSSVAPMAIPGTILVPMNGTDFGGLQGYVLGVNPETGDMMWKANMIPAKGEVGYDSWPEGSQTYGGAGPWITGSYDPASKTYFTGTANAYEWNPKNRGGGKMENLGAAGIVAVNTTNGKVNWRYTGVPGDPFDYDMPQTPMLLTLDGKLTIVQPNKTGFIHYLQPSDGKFIKATQFADKINWAKGYDANGRPIGMLPPPKEGPENQVELFPGLLGTVNMYPSAYNPKTGLVYMPATEGSMVYGMEDIKIVSNARHFGATIEFKFQNAKQVAYNAKTGAQVWRHDEDKPGYAGGMLTTAGNLTFYATQGGEFRAVDATTGKVLYSLNTHITSKSGPMTYTHKGKQYVVQALGGLPGFGRDDAYKAVMGSAMIAFTN